MQLIYKICSACNGIGEIPFIPQIKPGEESITKPGSGVICQRCKGEGYVPTGDFIPVKGQNILKQIDFLGDPDLIRLIKNKI